jgi:hypothetical protein
MQSKVKMPALTGKVLTTLLVLTTAAPSLAEVPGDMVYVTYSESGGSFRISELNRTIYYFSNKAQDYRPVCRNCEVTEWGDNITLKNGDRTIVQIDRISGRVLVRGTEASTLPGSFTQPFKGVCVRGKAYVPRKAPLKTARAF